MALNHEEIALVSKTFYQIAPFSDRAAQAFYNRLFEIAPQLSPLFKAANMREQRKKFIDMVALVVYSLDTPTKINAAIKRLGETHLKYGVEAEHYHIVGESLFWMLEQELGTDYTEAVADAWRKTYTMLSEIAIGAAYNKEE